MKKINAIIFGIIFWAGSISHVAAQENGTKGLFIGAGSGAILGQAIGNDTEATLIGTAIGSMLGYVIGNEMDKKPILYNSNYPSAYSSYSGSKHRKKLSRKQRTYGTNIYKYPTTHRKQNNNTICRKTEIIATIDGQPQKVLTTACLQNGYWIINTNDFSQSRLQFNTHRKPYGRRNYERNYNYATW